MILGKYFKASADRKRYSIDYSDWLDVGEFVSTCVFSVTPVDSNPVVIDGNAIASGSQSVVFYASSGIEGTTYKVLVHMTTSNGQVKEDTVQYTVKAP